MKKATHKMDKYLIATLQKFEIEWIQKVFNKKGIHLTSSQIKSAVKLIGRSRKSVYKYLTISYGKKPQFAE